MALIDINPPPWRQFYHLQAINVWQVINLIININLELSHNVCTRSHAKYIFGYVTIMKTHSTLTDKVCMQYVNLLLTRFAGYFLIN